MTKGYEYNVVETALCLWEAVLEAEIKASNAAADAATSLLGQLHAAYVTPWARQREEFGTNALRANIIELASVCSQDWFDNDGPDLGLIQLKYPAFDWDYCAHWLEHCVDWANVIPGCHAYPKSDALRMAALGLTKPSDNLTPVQAMPASKAPFTPLPTSAESKPVPPARPKQAPVCRQCTGPNVCNDGTVRWDADAQEWSLTEVLDDKSASCDDCEGETRLDWLDIVPHQVIVRRMYQVHALHTVDVMAPNAKCAEVMVANGDVSVPKLVMPYNCGWDLTWEQQGVDLHAGYIVEVRS